MNSSSENQSCRKRGLELEEAELELEPDLMDAEEVEVEVIVEAEPEEAEEMPRTGSERGTQGPRCAAPQ